MATILVIDDDRLVRRDVVHALKKAGYEVIEASGAVEGIGLAHTEQPDLILLDILMAEMDGITVLRQLRADTATCEIPIIMISSLGSADQVAACLEEGAVDHITKPFSHRVLTVHVSAGLRKGATPLDEVDSVDSTENDTADAGSDGSVEVIQPEFEARSKDVSETAVVIQPEVSVDAKIRKVNPGDARVVSFLGAKGGVGTTTSVANIATFCALEGHSVILAELRSTVGTLGIQFNTNPYEHLGTLLARDRSTMEFSDSEWSDFLIRDSSGLRMLFGPQADDGDVDLTADEASRLIDVMRPLADLIVIDLSSGLSNMNLEVLKRSDLVVLVLDCEATSIATAKATIDQLERWSIRHAIKASVVKRTELSIPPKINEIHSLLGCEMVGIVPPGANALSHAVSAGCPLAVLHPEDDLCNAYRKLAQNHLLAEMPSLSHA